MLKSTRSNISEDAHRDFDGFDANEELKRFRAACDGKKWKLAAELASNLDESMSRGGPEPVEWLGPSCMQTGRDIRTRRKRSLKSVSKN